MARMITRTSKDLVGAISGYFKVNSIELSQIFVFFSEHTNFYSDLKIGKCGHHAWQNRRHHVQSTGTVSFSSVENKYNTGYNSHYQALQLWHQSSDEHDQVAFPRSTFGDDERSEGSRRMGRQGGRLKWHFRCWGTGFGVWGGFHEHRQTSWGPSGRSWVGAKAREVANCQTKFHPAFQEEQKRHEKVTEYNSILQRFIFSYFYWLIRFI